MQNQLLAQESDSLWKLPSIGARAEGEETVTFASKQPFTTHLKIKATMATEPHFFSSAEHFLSLQRNTQPLK